MTCIRESTSSRAATRRPRAPCLRLPVLVGLIALLAISLTACRHTPQSSPVQAPQSSLLEQAAATQPSAYAFAQAVDADIVPTTDGRGFAIWWSPLGFDEGHGRTIVALHGHESYAFVPFEQWQRLGAERGYAVLSLQWWDGSGNTLSDYYDPAQVYEELDAILSARHVGPGRVLYEGFSMASANSYAVTEIDRNSGQRYFALTLANAGGAAPATRDRFADPSTFDETHWALYCGGLDPDPDQNGCPAMSTTKTWLESLGATVDLFIQDPDGDHGSLHRDPDHVLAVLDLFEALAATR